MSKKKELKKAQEQERIAAELEMQRQEQSQAAKRAKGPTASFRVMNNCAPVPVARPADFIQLTPIVQPMSLVPYSSQTQPLAMFDEDEF